MDFHDLGFSLGTKISPKPDFGAILGTKIGPKGPKDVSKRGPRRRQEGQKRKAASPRRPETRPDADFQYPVAAWPDFGGQNRSKNAFQHPSYF